MMRYYTSEDAARDPYFFGWVKVADFRYAINECYVCGIEETNEAFHNCDTWLCQACGVLVQRGIDLAEARIIELLDELIPAKPVYEMPMEYWVQRKLVEKAIALIKGETE